MNDRSPIVAFGLKATAIALKAKTENLRLKDKLDLATSALVFMGDNEEVRDAVVAFNVDVDLEPIAAAERLQDLAAKLAPESDPRRPEIVLKAIEEERRLEAGESDGVQVHDWQLRKDLQ